MTWEDLKSIMLSEKIQTIVHIMWFHFYQIQEGNLSFTDKNQNYSCFWGG